MGNLSIQIQGLVKDYPGTRALDGVSFGVERGAIHGFLGPNGAGKSTTINIVTGLMAPTAGEVLVEGESVIRSRERVCGRMGLLPENLPLYLNMRVKDYLQFCRDIGSFRHRPRLIPLTDVLGQCGLGEVGHRLIGNLSKGYRQRVGIAQALVARPSILILDEPMNGLDPVAVREMRQLILRLAGEHTILLSSHRLQEMSTLCSHLTIIKAGKIVKTGCWEGMREGKLTLLLTGWRGEMAALLQEQLGVGPLDVQSGPSGVRVQMSVPDDRELRARVSRLLVEQGCGLLEIAEEAPELEDIFYRVTQEGTAEMRL